MDAATSTQAVASQPSPTEAALEAAESALADAVEEVLRLQTDVNVTTRRHDADLGVIAGEVELAKQEVAEAAKDRPGVSLVVRDEILRTAKRAFQDASERLDRENLRRNREVAELQSRLQEASLVKLTRMAERNVLKRILEAQARKA